MDRQGSSGSAKDRTPSPTVDYSSLHKRIALRADRERRLDRFGRDIVAALLESGHGREVVRFAAREAYAQAEGLIPLRRASSPAPVTSGSVDIVEAITQVLMVYDRILGPQGGRKAFRAAVDRALAEIPARDDGPATPIAGQRA
jgi:hypothetical protein